uniref:Lysosomal-associated transmembrane protein n=1 Tax=Panagrolaimus sp. JU765 TaxID=591449 RepID=A0AC34QXY5_9BILA
MTVDRTQPSLASNRVCCCGLKTAGYIVALVELALCVLALYGLVRNFTIFRGPYLFWFVVGIISIIIIILAVIFLIYAIRKQKPRYLLPHLMAQISLILFLFIVALVVALLLLFGAYKGIRRLLGHGDYYMSDESTEILGYLIIVVYLAVAFLECFFLWIIYKLWLHFREYQLIKSGKYDFTSAEGYNSNDWYIPPKNHHAYGGSPASGDVYPYEPPVTPPPQNF